MVTQTKQFSCINLIKTLILIITFTIVTARKQTDQDKCCWVSDEELEEFKHLRKLSHKFIIVIGVQKCGTTLIYDLLAQHPQTARLLDKKYGTGVRLAAKTRFSFKNYIKHFNLSALEQGFTMIEATPTYILYPRTACRIKQFLPNAKFIVTVKNPADRALSQFKMQELFRYCNCKKIRFCKPCGRPLSDFYTPALEFIQNFKKRNCNLQYQSWQDCFGCYPFAENFLMRGFYAAQIQSWMEYFTAEQFLIVKQKDLYNAQQEANRIFEFANLAPFQLEQVKGFQGVKHKASDNINKTLELLEVFYAPYNQMFKDMLKNDFNMKKFSFF